MPPARASPHVDVQYAPRNVVEEFCTAVLQLATLMQRHMAGFNLIVTARLREIAENANESMGGLTLGAAVLLLTSLTRACMLNSFPRLGRTWCQSPRSSRARRKAGRRGLLRNSRSRSLNKNK
jgi:hypothetical protein